MEYFKILNLSKEPFSNSPDPEFFYGARQHVECLQKIELSCRLRRGLNVVIGDVGIGKTTLCRQLVRKFAADEKLETHFILDPYFSSSLEFLSTIAKMFDEYRPETGTSEWQLKEIIKNYLFRRGVDENKTVALIIDEGQKFPDYCLEILREFLNYETNEYKLLQIVIFAQREFEKALKEYPNFADRINLYHFLDPLNFRDTRMMIQFRLDQAAKGKKRPSLFSYPAIWSVYRATQGYPRKIIHLCHRMILALIIQNRSKAGWFLARSCAKRVFPYQSRKWQWTTIAALTGLAAAALMLELAPEQLKVLKTWKGEDPSIAFTQKEVYCAKIAIDRIGATPSSASERASVPSTPKILSSEVVSAPMVTMDTIRGARHEDYSSIVFQFEKKVRFEKPIIKEEEAVVRLKNVTTKLPSFRQYKTFDSWVKIEKIGNDLNARIGLPKRFIKFHCFLMKDPCRLVINLYSKDHQQRDT